MDPSAFEAGGFVVHKRDFAFTVLVVSSGGESCVCEHLEAVADADYELVLFGKVEDFFLEIVFEFVCECISSAGIVCV